MARDGTSGSSPGQRLRDRQVPEMPVCRPLAVRCYASAMVRRGVRRAGLIIAIALFLVPTGCMGWGDMFAPTHRISGDYFLQQGEDPKGDEVYLFVKGASVSVAGRRSQPVGATSSDRRWC